MSAPTPYLHFPGTARDALRVYAEIFGGSVELNTFEEFGRTDGPSDAVAHGVLRNGAVDLYAADAGEGEASLQCTGLMLSLLGRAEPATLRQWFTGLADGGVVVDDLQRRPWGASDGQVIDRFGLHWLIGFEADSGDDSDEDYAG